MLALPVDDQLTLLQRALAESLFSDIAPIPATIREGSGGAYASRFSVYRNNVFASLTGAIAAHYPVVRKLLWEEAFNQIAHLYVTAEPPVRQYCSSMATAFQNSYATLGKVLPRIMSLTLPNWRRLAHGPITPPT